MRFGRHLEQGVRIIGNALKPNSSRPRKLAGLEGGVSNMFADMLTTPVGAAWWAEVHQSGRFVPSASKTVVHHVVHLR